jgi:hypothetical protein
MLAERTSVVSVRPQTVSCSSQEKQGRIRRRIQQKHSYTFQAAADGPCFLTVGDRKIKDGKGSAHLVAGAHNLNLVYAVANNAATKSIKLSYSGPDTNDSLAIIPAAVLQHSKLDSLHVLLFYSCSNTELV